MRGQKLYRVYLTRETPMSSVFGFNRRDFDGNRYQDRYLTEKGKEDFIGEMWALGITGLKFKEIDG